MSLLCELTGTVPSEPVVTPEGHLFERRIIEQHLENQQTCPITGNNLQKKDLITISQKPIRRPSQAIGQDMTSLLGAIQAQFDTLHMENVRVTQERDQARQQITHLLYVRDGATRALAQKMTEIEALTKEIEKLKGNSTAATGAGTARAATSGVETTN